MNKKRFHTLLPLVQLLPTVAAAAAVLFALPRTVPVLAAVPEKLTTVVEQPVEAASSEAEEETLPKLPYADGVYVGSSRGYGGAVRVQVTMENGSITEVEILDASHETKQFLRRAKRLLTTVVDAQSWEVDAVSEATYTSRGILGAVQNALTGEVVNNPLPPQPEPAAPLVVEEFIAPSTYLDGIYTAEATRRTYALLHTTAAMVLDAGWSVVVDAAFLKRHERDSFRALAAERGADFAILACSAPLHEMRHRLETRQHDASEATVDVLERQLDWVEPLAADETAQCIPMLDPEQGRLPPGA